MFALRLSPALFILVILHGLWGWFGWCGFFEYVYWRWFFAGEGIYPIGSLFLLSVAGGGYFSFPLFLVLLFPNAVGGDFLFDWVLLLPSAIGGITHSS